MAEVLVVEDEPSVRQLLVMALEAAGHDVRTACDGTSALDALEVAEPDCIILDVMMPNVDGYGVLRSMRRRQLATDARVIMLTCRTEERDFVRGWELGADEYLTKPFEVDSLLRTVSAVMRATPEVLAQRRSDELLKAHLLDRLEMTAGLMAPSLPAAESA